MLTVDVVTLASLRRELGGLGLGRVAGATLRALAMGLAGSVAGVLVGFAGFGLLGVDATASVGLAFAQVVAGGIPGVRRLLRGSRGARDARGRPRALARGVPAASRQVAGPPLRCATVSIPHRRRRAAPG